MTSINSHQQFLPDGVAAFIGLDWADECHVGCLWVPGATDIESFSLLQTPEAIDAWAAALRSRFDGGKIAICLEQRRGALIFALLKFDFLILCPINPKQLASYRKAFDPSGNKNDPGDADLLLDFLRRHPERVRVWKPDDAQTRLIGLLTEQRRRLVNQRTRLVNQLQSALKQAFPQALTLLDKNLLSKTAWHFLRRWPTLEDLKQARPSTLRRFFYGHQSRSEDRLQKRLDQIRQAAPLTTDPALLEALGLQVEALVVQLETLSEPIARLERRLDELMNAHQDASLFRSLPGAGKALAPRLLAAFGTDRDRYASAEEVQAYCGIAPVTSQSGRSKTVSWRWACPKFLRQTFQEFAQHSRGQSTWAAAYYQLQKSRGKSSQAALRALAFKWIRILYRCWKSRTPYDEARYLDALKRRNSPLLIHLQPAAESA
jgi:transposase